MKTLRRIAQLFFLLAMCAGISHAQLTPAQCTASPSSCLTQTTLTNVMGAGPTLYSGVSASYVTSLTIASTTNLVAAVNQVPQSIIFIDHEAMAVISFNSTTGVVQVTRSYGSTPAQQHAAGSMVLLGNLNQFNMESPYGGNWYAANGACLVTATLSNPFIDIQSGLQWICSTLTGTWVPGFGNTQWPAGLTTAVASVAGTTVPSGPFFHTTGTNAIVNWGIPLGFNANAVAGNPGQGCFSTIPDAVFTWTAAGNIALAGSAVVNKLLTFCWDSVNAKWIPNYIA